MKVEILSAVYGDYDQPIAPMHQTVECGYTLVTDRSMPVLDSVRRVTPRVIVESHKHLHPRVAAKLPKCRPDLYVDDDVETVIWIDGSFEITTSHFVDWCLGNSSGVLSQMAHPCRDDIVDEADASFGMQKYKGLRVHDQAHYYLDRGHRRHSGLWATGLMVWRKHPGHDPLMRDFGDMWLAEQILWTYQDQISEPYVARCKSIDIHTIPGDLWQPEHFRIMNHASEA